MNHLWIILIVCFALSHDLCSQTPEQSYFDWAQLPFSKIELEQRREHLIDLLQRQDKSGLVIIPARDGFSHGETFRQLDDFFYFTGLELPNSILVINTFDRSSTIFVPERDVRFESGTRVNDFPGRPLLTDREIENQTGLSMKHIDKFSDLMDQEVNSGSTIYINSGRQGPVIKSTPAYIATYSPIQILIAGLENKHPGIKFENIYSSIARIRMIKSDAEIAIMRQAVDITVKGIITAAKDIRPGISERFLEGVLEGDFKKSGAARLAFASIIKSGPNSLWPWRILATHYDRRNRIMEDGDLVIFDVGCEYKQYVSDVGRTFPISGSFSKRQKEILKMETNIADQIIAFIRPGISFNDIKQLTDRIIPVEAKPYMQVGLFFGHHLGLSKGDPNLPLATLQPGMIFTVEPWYYNHDEGISVFTEDVILVTPEGHEVLSKKLPRTPEELEKLMK